MIINILKNVFFRNFFNLTLNQGVNILVALIVTPILYQNLGQALFGKVSLYFSIMTLLNITVSYGYHLNGPKRIALLKKNIIRLQNFISEVVSIRLIIASLVFLIVIFASIIFEVNSDYDKIIFMFSLVCLYREALLPDFFVQGIDKLSYSAINNFFSKLIYILLIVSFIKSESDAFLVNFFFGLSSIFVYIFFWNFISKKILIVHVRLKFSNVIRKIKGNLMFFLASVAGHLSLHSSLVILTKFVSDVELGQFALSHRIIFLLRLVPTFFVQSILQRASILNHNNNLKDKFINKFFLIGLLLTAAIAIFVIIFSKYIIFILSGELVLLSQKVLIILSFVPMLAMLNFKNMIIILTNELQSVLYKASWISTFMMILICFIGSYYYGSIGISYSLLISEIITFIVFKLILVCNEKK